MCRIRWLAVSGAEGHGPLLFGMLASDLVLVSVSVGYEYLRPRQLPTFLEHKSYTYCPIYLKAKVRYYMPVTPALGRWKLEEQEFKATLGYLVLEQSRSPEILCPPLLPPNHLSLGCL